MNDTNHILIVKSDGSRVPFSRGKLIKALQNSGADHDQASQVVSQVEQRIYDGIPSKKIYQFAYSLLKKKSYHVAGRYRLKKAILELGPSGYPFEIFVGRLFESFGYHVKVGKQIKGKCVKHEVDVVATKPGEQVIVECKFHGDYRSKTNVKVPLYINSRFEDIKAKWAEDNQYKDLNVKGFVVTNSRFTLDAIQYAECAGLGLISWDYPKEGSLKYYIDRSGLYPVTSLHSLTRAQKKLILEEGIVLCCELIRHADIMRKHSFSEQVIAKVLKEAEILVK